MTCLHSLLLEVATLYCMSAANLRNQIARTSVQMGCMNLGDGSAGVGMQNRIVLSVMAYTGAISQRY